MGQAKLIDSAVRDFGWIGQLRGGLLDGALGSGGAKRSDAPPGVYSPLVSYSLSIHLRLTSREPGGTSLLARQCSFRRKDPGGISAFKIRGEKQPSNKKCNSRLGLHSLDGWRKHFTVTVLCRDSTVK